MSHQIIPARQLTRAPWKNGLGTTRVIATEEPHPEESRRAGPAADGGSPGPGFLWRLSLADLVDDSVFSALPGVDRVFTLVTAGPVDLHVGTRGHTLSAGRQVVFAGEEDVRAELGEVGPQQALNLMVDRSRAQGEVQVEQLESGWTELTATETAVVVLSGEVSLPGGGELTVGDALRPVGDLAIHIGGSAVVARVSVTPHRDGR
ncbi:HutD/Ves family protein [Nesterenkonia suensis]